jgi:uncharacterized protein (DUF1330 family)
MKRLSLSIIMAFVCIVCPAQTVSLMDNTVFNANGWLGIIVSNKVRFYELDEKFYGSQWSKEWRAKPEYDFTLPNGYKSVFSIENIICVLVDNKVQFYIYYENRWQIMPELELTLPNGYQSVFWGRAGIGVVVGNKIRFYQQANDYRWQIMPELELTLSSGYQSVFSFGVNLGVVVNNKVQFYTYEDNSWQIFPEELTLPNGYKSVFWTIGVGVVVGNRIQFYDIDDDNSWQTFPELDLTLPNGYQSVFLTEAGMGVVAGNKIQFYDMDDNGWQRKPELDLTLPNVDEMGPQPVFVSLNEITRDYRSNEITASSKWGGKDVVIEGRIHSIEIDMFGRPIIYMFENNEMVHFIFPDGYSLTRYRAGERIRIRGWVGSKFIGINIIDCNVYQ